MKRQDWHETIAEMPVFDTHTHLNMPGVPVTAQTFWDIAHYFWFQQELWSVGYPHDAPELPELQRTAAFVSAFNAVRNTHWHRVVCAICRDLYNQDLTDADGLCTPDRVTALDAAVREHAQQYDWAQAVIDRLAIRRIAVNALSEADFLTSQCWCGRPDLERPGCLGGSPACGTRPTRRGRGCTCGSPN